jgi:uncharacterized membrane protein YkoI
MLPVLCVAVLATGVVQASDRNQKDDAGSAPAKAEVLMKTVLVGKEGASVRQDPPGTLAAAGKEEPPKRDDPPRPAPKVISMDRVVKQIEKKYKARVVRTDKKQRGDRLVYELKVLSDERLRTVRVDAETGEEL